LFVPRKKGKTIPYGVKGKGKFTTHTLSKVTVGKTKERGTINPTP